MFGFGRLPSPFSLSSIVLLAAGAGLALAAGNLNAAVIESVEVLGTQSRPALDTRAGDELRPATVRRDVRRLWRTGHYDDIRVESTEGDMLRVVFRLSERGRFLLREVRFDPPGDRTRLSLRPGEPVTEADARAAARTIEEQLAGDGFLNAQVAARLVPVADAQADLEIHIDRGLKFRIDSVEITGDPGSPGSDLRRLLTVTPRRRLPGIPGIWKGWIQRAPFRPGQIEADLAALRSHYIMEGFLAPAVGLGHVRIDGNRAAVEIRVDSGPRFHIENATVEGTDERLSVAASPRGVLPDLCRCLLAERSKGEREGRLDFQVSLDWAPLRTPAEPVLPHRKATESPVELNRSSEVLFEVSSTGPAPGRDAPRPGLAASLGTVLPRHARLAMELDAPAARRARIVARVDPGPQYRLGRIEFRGNNKLRDATLRRALIMDEGDWLDPRAIRVSLARLSQIEVLEPLSEADVQAQPAGDYTVDLTIAVRERKRGRWSLSGPLGPVSWFGPLHFAVDSRLPPWGRGVLDLSTWLATAGVVSHTNPVLGILSGKTKGVSGKTRVLSVASRVVSGGTRTRSTAGAAFGRAKVVSRGVREQAKVSNRAPVHPPVFSGVAKLSNDAGLTGEREPGWKPFTALSRPLLPGQPWTSGFLVSPALGWRERLTYSGLTHARAGAGRMLDAPGHNSLPLAMTFQRRDETDAGRVEGDAEGPGEAGHPAIVFCTPPKPHLYWLRSGAKLLLELAMGGS